MRQRVTSCERFQRWVLFVTLASAASVARANGRFPAANQLVIDASDSEHFLLRATYGLLSSHDAGRSFAWICEDVLGEVGTADPAVAILDAGRLVTAAQDQLMLSDASACSFVNTLGAGVSEFPVDVSNDPADPTLALAVARSGDGSGDVHLLEIDGNSAASRVIGSSLGNDLFPLTLDAAPSEPNRIYVTALSTSPSSLLLSSPDRGESWERIELHPYEKLQAYIAAIDPNDAQKLYVRVNDEPNDHLLVSTDGGEHFSEPTLVPTKLLGFALSPDGSSLAVGGPGVPIQTAGTDELAFVASGSTLSLLSCLKWTDDGLYACADDHADGFTLGLSSDEGASFAPLFHASELAPLVCDGTTSVGDRCPRVWSSVDAQIAAGTASSASASSSLPSADGSKRPASGTGCEMVPGPTLNSRFLLVLFGCALAFAGRRSKRGRVAPRRG